MHSCQSFSSSWQNFSSSTFVTFLAPEMWKESTCVKRFFSFKSDTTLTSVHKIYRAWRSKSAFQSSIDSHKSDFRFRILPTTLCHTKLFFKFVESLANITVLAGSTNIFAKKLIEICSGVTENWLIFECNHRMATVSVNGWVKKNLWHFRRTLKNMIGSGHQN